MTLFKTEDVVESKVRVWFWRQLHGWAWKSDGPAVAVVTSVCVVLTIIDDHRIPLGGGNGQSLNLFLQNFCVVAVGINVLL